MRRASATRTFPQTLAKFFRALRPREQAIDQRTQVKSSPSDDDWQVASPGNFAQHFSRAPRVLARRHQPGGVHDVKQMMWHSRSLRRARLGSPDLELPHHGDGIAIHDLALKLFGERQRERGLAARSRAEDHDEKRVGHGQRNNWWMEVQ